jgi:hypothetical protein
VLGWISHTLHQTHGRRAGIRTVPFYGRAMRGKLGISPEIVLAVRATAPGGVLSGSLRCRSLAALWATWQQVQHGVKNDGCARGPNRCANDGYYEVHKQVCIDSRRSRLLWGSGNARRNRMDVGHGDGAGFPNPDDANVGVLENRSIGRWEQSKSPTASTGGDVRCAMPLEWMGGNMGSDRAGSGDGSVWFSTVGRLGTGFAVNPQMRVDCGGPVSVRRESGPCGGL